MVSCVTHFDGSDPPAESSELIDLRDGRRFWTLSLEQCMNKNSLKNDDSHDSLVEIALLSDLLSEFVWYICVIVTESRGLVM